MIRVVQKTEWPNEVILESFDDIKNATLLSGWLPRRWAVRHSGYKSRLLLTMIGLFTFTLSFRFLHMPLLGRMIRIYLPLFNY